jgi:hypothetical protein
MKAKTTRRKSAPRNPNEESYQVALLHLYGSMRNLLAAGGLLRLAADGKLPENEYDYLADDDVYELCAGIVHEHANNLYRHVEELIGAVGIEHDHQRARRIAEERDELKGSEAQP